MRIVREVREKRRGGEVYIIARLLPVSHRRADLNNSITRRNRRHTERHFQAPRGTEKIPKKKPSLSPSRNVLLKNNKSVT